MPDLSLTPRERALIGLLVTGHTDAMAARELHISERSVTSIMRSLMDRVGVSNRFQLGVALGTLRIAPAPPGLAERQSTVDSMKSGETEPEPAS
jgi:DNA-binding NarL/FixJ family response regulator